MGNAVLYFPFTGREARKNAAAAVCNYSRLQAHLLRLQIDSRMCVITVLGPKANWETRTPGIGLEPVGQ
jgi:hypothetical protein